MRVLRTGWLAWVFAVVSVAAAACGTGAGGGGASGFCSQLGSSPGCRGEGEVCVEREAVARTSMPTCRAALDALLACLATTELSCVSGSDFDVYASAGGSPEQRPVGLFGPYQLRVRGPRCATEVETWRGCQSCGASIGYGGTLGGVGDPCSSAGQCAAGLECEMGACTRACTAGGGECRPRHPRDGCATSTGRDTICDNGRCRPYCRTGGASGYICPPQ